MDQQISTQEKLIQVEKIYADEIKSWIDLFWIPPVYVHSLGGSVYRKYKLSFLQRVFLTLEFPASSFLSKFVAWISCLVIVSNILSFLISSMPSVKNTPSSCDFPACSYDDDLCPTYEICAPVAASIYEDIDLFCVIFFTVDFGVRLLLCGFMPTRLSGTVPDHWDDLEREAAFHKNRVARDEPEMTRVQQFLRYLFSFHSIVDIISITPTYVALALHGSSSIQLSFMRILKLMRMLRVLRINMQGRTTIEMLGRTMHRSREAVSLLLFYLILVVLLFASLMHALEEGVFEVTSSYPSGAFLRPNGYGGQAESPFDSIPTAIYYVFITITTVGYGDISPTTMVGRAVSSVIAIVGVFVIALPVSVIGSNFSEEYKKHLERLEENVVIDEAKKMLAKRWWILIEEKFWSYITQCCTKRKSFSKIDEVESPSSDVVESGDAITNNSGVTDDNVIMKVISVDNYNGDVVHSSAIEIFDENKSYMTSPGMVETADSQGVTSLLGFENVFNFFSISSVDSTVVIPNKQTVISSLMNMTVEELITISKDNLIQLLCLLLEDRKSNIEKMNRINEIAKQLEAVSVKST